MSYLRLTMVIMALAFAISAASAFVVIEGMSTSSEECQSDADSICFEKELTPIEIRNHSQPMDGPNEKSKEPVKMDANPSNGNCFDFQESEKSRNDFKNLIDDMGHKNIEPMKNNELVSHDPTREVRVKETSEPEVDIEVLKEVVEYLEENDGDEELINEIKAIIDFEMLSILVESSYFDSRIGRESSEDDVDGIDSYISIEEDDGIDAEQENAAFYDSYPDAECINILIDKTGAMAHPHFNAPIVTADI